MNYKEITKTAYEIHAKEYEENTKDYLKNYLIEDCTLFRDKLKGKKILDIGCGPGRDALYFQKKGFDVTCIDISNKMIELCNNKGLKGIVMDFENLEFEKQSFDGVWAYTSLIHASKSAFPQILKKINTILKDDGILYLGMKEGSFEGINNDNRHKTGEKRFVSLYLDSELKEILNNYFSILHTSKVTIDKKSYLNYLCKKK